MSSFTAVGFFLTSLVFGLAIFALWLRIALRYFRVSSLTPFGRLIYGVTEPVVGPLNSLFGLKQQPGQRYDWMAFAVLIFVELIKIICLSLLAFHQLIPFLLLLVYVLADLIIQPCDLLFYVILIRVIMSYVNPGWHNPTADFLRMISEPLLIKGRKIVPDIAGFDFSPFIIMILLKIITLFISASLPGRLL